MTNINFILSQKELALCDFGSVRMVRPTGRYIDAKDAEFFEERLRYSVEVKTGWFETKWVLACNLKPVLKMARA